MLMSAPATGCRHRARTTCAHVALLAVVWVGLTAGGCGGGTGLLDPSPRDYVLDPAKVHFGGSYSDWSVLWWQWAQELPRANHPLFDQTGADALQGQVEPVYFLGGLFGLQYAAVTTTATRTVTIPSGVSLFFPIINTAWDNSYCLPPGWVPLTAAQLAAVAYDQVNQVSDVLCEIDGAKIIDSPDLSGAAQFRAVSGTFQVDLPADNIGVQLCGTPAVPLHIDPQVSDGIWMMLAPMPSGPHTIKFAGSLPVTGGALFRLEVTYNLTVLPPP